MGKYYTIEYRGWEIEVNEYINGSCRYTVWVDCSFTSFDNLDDVYTYIDEIGFDGDYSLGTPKEKE